MRYLPILLIFLTLSLFAQTQKGAGAIAKSAETTGTTRAVIVGISNYQNDEIPDLRFADKDAEAFAKYLQSPGGGNLSDENIRLLTNTDATMAAVASELDWLVEESTEGDKAIIYFSGHGDVEAKTMSQPGFLLTYDSPPKIYIAGAYPLFYLQLIIQTLSTQKNVQTIVITDACRAGKLAGSEIGGTQATAANLAKQYANEIKILSCQLDEFSLEGEQWGGGRGAFSYHLIEGLIGLADGNDDSEINLKEIGRYLEDRVSEEVAPQNQNPLTIGSKSLKIADINPADLQKLKDEKARQLPVLASIKSKGLEENVLAKADSSVRKMYDEFIAALENDRLLDSENDMPSADELYRKLMNIKSLEPLRRFMTRKFAIALQDDAQQAVNAYLLANPNELEKRQKGDTKYEQYPRYLQRAAELLGESHYMYNYLIAKQLYFEGLDLRLTADRSSKGFELYFLAIEKQKMALNLEPRAAFLYNELGVLNTRLKGTEEAILNFKKAIEAAPEWGLPYVNYCIELFYSGQYEKSLEYGYKALEFLPEFPQLYNFLAWIHANDHDWIDKKTWERKGTELSYNMPFTERNIFTKTQNQKRYKKSIELLQKAKEVDSTYFHAYLNLGAIYSQIEEYEKAETELKKAIELNPTDYHVYFPLGRLYLRQYKTDEGEAILLKKIELSPKPMNIAAGYNSLTWAYGQKGDTEAEIAAWEKSMEIDPNFKASFTNLADTYISLGEFEKAEAILLDVLKTKPVHLYTYVHLGRAYELMNRPKDAEYIYLKGIQQKPNYLRLLNALFGFYIKNGRKKNAKEILEMLLRFAPDDLTVRWNIALEYLKGGKRRKAKKYATQAKNLNPQKRRIHGYYSACFSAIEGDQAAACARLSAAFDEGYHNYDKIRTDPNLKNIHGATAFRKLIEKQLPGKTFKFKPVPDPSLESVYFSGNCGLLAEFYESDGKENRAKFLRTQMTLRD